MEAKNLTEAVMCSINVHSFPLPLCKILGMWFPQALGGVCRLFSMSGRSKGIRLWQPYLIQVYSILIQEYPHPDLRCLNLLNKALLGLTARLSHTLLLPLASRWVPLWGYQHQVHGQLLPQDFLTLIPEPGLCPWFWSGFPCLSCSCHSFKHWS